jgi:hypothetical protein
MWAGSSVNRTRKLFSWSVSRRRPGGCARRLKIGHAHADITRLLAFPNNLTFDRLALFCEYFQLPEMIHNASFVTCVHVRSARLWAVGRLRAVGH